MFWISDIPIFLSTYGMHVVKMLQKHEFSQTLIVIKDQAIAVTLN